MIAFSRSIATVALATLPAISAWASQGPGTTGGTATGLEQGVFIAVLAAATCIGLVALRLKRR